MVAATHAIFAHKRTEFRVFLDFFLEKRLFIYKRSAHKRGALDIDMPARETRGQTCVLTLFANGERQLVIRNDHRRVMILLVDGHRVHLGR